MTATSRILLDTSVVIDMGSVDLGAHASAPAALSTVTIAELSYGLDVDDPVERLARSRRLERALTAFEILPFDVDAARLYGTLASLVRHNGRNPRPRRLDLQIAATAAAHRLPLLTRNPADFVDVVRVVEVIEI
ncbi:PIN domain-containing protein [Jiangella anatolica]|uniref:PIN domain-containing protein n=1 Tax=Jiangella anatolica TaxID=2670374 RepID=UPI0018F32D85|nr:PIN domain-containing protein [Jiangella anatolica]